MNAFQKLKKLSLTVLDRFDIISFADASVLE